MKINKHKCLALLLVGLGCVLAACSNIDCPPGESILIRTSRASFFGSAPMYAVSATGEGDLQCNLPKIYGDNPDWSPDGSWIAYDTTWVSHPNDSQVYLVPSTGDKTIQVTDYEMGASDASWSPDGSQIAFVGNGIKVLDVDCLISKTECNLSSHDIGVGRNPDWSPDGDHIVYQRFSQQAERSFDIIVIDLRNPKHLRDVTPAETRGCSNPKWSPDGKRIAASCLTENLHDIFVIDWKTFRSSNLTDSPGVIDVNPEWSLDGRRIAFESDGDEELGECLNADCTSTSRSLFIMNDDGTGITRLNERSDEDILWLSWLP